MSLALLTVTNFPELIKLNSRCILISSDDLNNSNFIINQYIQALSKGLTSPLQSNQETMIFCLFINQTYTNYSFIQMKCGNNLKNLKERNVFRCLDVLSDLDQFMSKSEDFKDKSDMDNQFNFKKFETIFLNQLNDYFNDSEDKSKESLKVLIIDDITTLLSLNVELSQLINFLNHLKHYCSINKITLIIQSFLDSIKLDQLVKLDAFLNSISDLVLLVSKLETGYSNKVDGNLRIKNFITNTQQSYLFKSTERITKLYSPGTI